MKGLIESLVIEGRSRIVLLVLDGLGDLPRRRSRRTHAA